MLALRIRDKGFPAYKGLGYRVSGLRVYKGLGCQVLEFGP